MTEKVVPLGIVSLSLWNEARDYIVAAETLVRESQVKLPTYFLLSHALELTIKSYLAAHGVDADELHIISHDLQRAYDKSVGLGFQIEPDRAPKLIRLFSEFHKEQVFRYLTKRNRGLVVIRKLVDAADALEIVTSIWNGVGPDAMRARFRAVTAGQFPIEEWYMGGASDA
jgi:HEPN domain-containing protein